MGGGGVGEGTAGDQQQQVSQQQQQQVTQEQQQVSQQQQQQVTQEQAASEAIRRAVQRVQENDGLKGEEVERYAQQLAAATWAEVQRQQQQPQQPHPPPPMSSLDRIRALAATDRARVAGPQATENGGGAGGKPQANGGGNHPAPHGFGSAATAASTQTSVTVPPPQQHQAADRSNAAASLVSLAGGGLLPPSKDAAPTGATASGATPPANGNKETDAATIQVLGPGRSTAAASPRTETDSAAPKPDEPQPKPKRSKKPPPREQEIMPRALGEGGMVDIHAYHRGRAGVEPRSPRSGDLLCDLDPSDTGQQFARNKDGEKSDGAGAANKNMVVTINLSFPLCDVEDVLEEKKEEEMENAKAAICADGEINEKFEAATASKEDDDDVSAVIPRFHDQIEWDLSSPDMPTAMGYATSVASEFGLSFGQTLDLASSIQKQIDSFVQSSGIIRPLPVAAKDPHGVNRPAGSSVILLPTLHGGAHGGGGTVQVIAQQQQGSGVVRSNPSRSSTRASAASSGRSRQRGQVRPDKVEFSVVPEHLLKTYETEDDKYSTPVEFRREVVKRAKEEFRQKLLAENEENDSNGMVGSLEFVKDEVCHVCHKRKSAGVRFSCSGHVLCDYHCCTRMGFSAKAIRDGHPMALDYCPICCRTCLCSRCTKKLDDVSSHFQRLCQNQGITDNPALCQAGNMLELCGGQTSSLQRAKNESKKASKKRRAPADADDAASQSSRGSRSARETAAPRSAKQEKEPPPPRKIGKPKPSEFPVEACGGFDLDPSLENDNRTVFLPDGVSYVRKEAPVPPPNPEDVELVGADPSIGIVEDGSVDYCQHCQQGGDLICCDRCPRSFHADCLPSGLDEDDIPDSDWMCHLCVRDSSAQPNNDISGTRTLGLITAAYTGIDHCDGFTQKLLTISKVRELISLLVVFDFGYMFKDPVSVKDVPDYTRLVKKPMNLETIRSNLINLKYMKAVKKNLANEKISVSQMGARIMDEIIISALKDLELIYHNCFTYNVRGTAVYRMAEVQRRKAKMVIEKSIVPSLDEESLRRLEEYSKRLETSREENLARGPKRVSPSAPHKIDVPFTHSSNGRIIAVFDPTKNMVVKQYSSVRGAGKAALYLVELGYEPELKVTDSTIKNLIRKSGRDPSQQLFQYRWIYLDDLRSGRVTIIPLPISEKDEAAMAEAKAPGKDSSSTAPASKVDSSKSKSSPKNKSTGSEKVEAPVKKKDEEKAKYCIERRTEGRTIYYKSIEAVLDALNQEAILARAALVAPEKFQESLESVPPGDEVVTMGSRWRLLETAPRLTDNGMRPNLPIHPDDKGKEKSDSDTITCYPGLAAVFSLGHDTFFEPSMDTAPPHCIIVKVCRLSNKILGGFESIPSAFEDWKQCRNGVLCSSAPSEPVTVEAFHTLYVQGEKNVEGLEWKELSLSSSSQEESRFLRPPKESRKRPLSEVDGGTEKCVADDEAKAGDVKDDGRNVKPKTVNGEERNPSSAKMDKEGTLPSDMDVEALL